MIRFSVKDTKESIRKIALPEGINLNLMEALKASEYLIDATCGGMALCTTCHVEVQKGFELLQKHRKQNWKC